MTRFASNTHGHTQRIVSGITVHSGDTLFSVARKHHISVAEIKQLNSLKSNSLHPGQRLILRS